MVTRAKRRAAAGLVLVLAALGGAAARESLRRPFTYDEAAHAHMAWLLDRGHTPYRDFASNHLPFFWMLLRPAVRLLPESTTMWYTVLRGVALAGHAAFLALLAGHAARDAGRGAFVRALGAVGVMAVAPPVFSFLVEFRPDSVANPLLLGGLWLLRGRPRRAAAGVGGFLVAAALLINTKYLLLPAILGLLAACRAASGHRPDPAEDRPGFPAAAAWAAGGAVLALAAAWGLLRAQGIDPSEAWHLAVRYNAAAEQRRTFGFGLWRGIWSHPVLLGYAALGACGVAWRAARSRAAPGLWVLGLTVFLAAQALLVTKPWLQYKASWFLLAASLPAVLVARDATDRARRRAILAWGLTAALAVGHVLAVGRPPDPLIRLPDGRALATDRATQARVVEFLLRQAAPEEYVVAEYPWQPPCRLNTFYKLVTDYDGQGRDALEWAAQALPGLPYAERMNERGYRAELDRRPPAVIFLGVFTERGPVWSPYTEQRTRAIEAFLEARGNEYALVDVPGTSFAVMRRVKPGEAERPR